MVVLSAALCTKNGKVLLSRQFIEVSRIRIEGLLSAFPKLLQHGKEHTFIESETVRYVYQPIEELLLLLVTNKQSNIVEDLEVLRLMARIVPEFCGDMTEAQVQDKAFDLVFAFDEVLGMGNRDSVSLPQIRTALEMDSNEERLQKMILESKIAEANKVAQQRAKEIEQQNVARSKAGSMSGGSSLAQGFGNAFNEATQQAPSVPSVTTAAPERRVAPKKGKGLSLGGKAKKTDSLMKALAEEGEISQPHPGGAAAHTNAQPASASGAQASFSMQQEAVHAVVQEVITATYSRDGMVDDCEIRGDLLLTVNSDNAGFAALQIEQGNNKLFQFKTHPNIDKPAFNKNKILQGRDPTRPFPTGAQLGILKWRSTSASDLIPLTLSCWPSPASDSCVVTLEYELQSEQSGSISNLTVSIPVSGQPKILSCAGDCRYDAGVGCLEWTVDTVDQDSSSGSLEFQTPPMDVDSFFPIEVYYEAEHPCAGVRVLSATSSQDGASLPLSTAVDVKSQGSSME